MSLTTSTVTPLIVQTSSNQNIPNYVTIINPDGTVSYEPNKYYQQPTVIRRSYAKARKPEYRYSLEQEGESYRCCQWCRYWCTRKYPIFDFCDRMISCPLLFFILSGLFLLSLFIALLTLFGLHPNINSARRYYGTISQLSIVNRTKYIFKLDQLCSRTSFINNCLDIMTSTSIVNVATTITINGTITAINYSYTLLVSCLLMYCIYRKVCFYAI